MQREDLVQRIAELDQQINQSVSQTKVPSLNVRNRTFPWSYWTSVILFAALWLYGGMFIPEQYDWTGPVFLVLAGLFLIMAVIKTLIYLFKKGQKVDKNYVAKTEKVRELQARRQELQKQLNEMDKA